jgi:hypothetical protein
VEASKHRHEHLVDEVLTIGVAADRPPGLAVDSFSVASVKSLRSHRPT